MRFFLAGIMQGSHLGAVLHNQNYRERLKSLLLAHFPGSDVYDPLADHGQSLQYNDDTGRQVFCHHNRMCREVDVVIAVVPEASMGTAIEMWEAHEHGRAVVLTISPMSHNWAIKFCSHAVFGNLEEFEDAVRSGRVQQLIAEKGSSEPEASARDISAGRISLADASGSDKYRSAMQHILDISHEQLTTWLKERGYPGYRAAQIRKWLFQSRIETFEEMSDLPKKLRTELAEAFAIWTSTIATHSTAGDGTEKLLLQLADGGRIECVLLRDAEQRRTICISSQVGCAMGCVFCASGLDGVDRDLTSGEIIEEMLRLARLLPAEERLSHIVVMGMGEPLANLDRLLPALDAATRDDGLGISHRRITISTVGLPKQIEKLIERDTRFHLAVSLHAPNDDLRNKLVPVNKSIGIAPIIEAADRYFDQSGRRLTFEYVLLGGINDARQHAEQLAALLRGRTALLNVIPYNPVAGLPYQTPSQSAIRQFREILERGGINVQFRERKGDEINAACGQLRRITPVVTLEPQAQTPA